MPSMLDGAGVDLVEAHQQVDDRGLAGAGRADDGQHLARSDVGVEVVDQRPVRLVPERYAVESHVAGHVLEQDRFGGVGNLLRLVEQLEDALGRGHRRLQKVRDAGHLRDRLRERA